MKYFKMSMDISRVNDVICHYDDDYGIQQNELITGKKCMNWENRFQFFYHEYEGEILTDYLANDKGWFVVSGELKRLLESVNTEIQFLPVEIIDRDNSKNSIYFIANILRLVDALCLEESEYFVTEIPTLGNIYTISDFAIFKNKVGENDIFKLSNRQEIPIFVSERFKNMVKEKHLTGMEFLEVKTI